MTKQWRTLTGVPVEDVVDFVRENALGGQAVHLGTDSLQLARHTRFVTVVAILTPGRGSHRCGSACSGRCGCRSSWAWA